METIKDWITPLSFIALIVGWFINSHLNRKNEIAKKRIEYRLQMLQAFFNVYFFIAKNKDPFKNPALIALLDEAQIQFILYGENDEVILYKKFIKSFQGYDSNGVDEALMELEMLMRTRLRKELNIKPNKPLPI